MQKRQIKHESFQLQSKSKWSKKNNSEIYRLKTGLSSWTAQDIYFLPLPLHIIIERSIINGPSSPVIAPIGRIPIVSSISCLISCARRALCTTGVEAIVVRIHYFAGGGFSPASQHHARHLNRRRCGNKQLSGFTEAGVEPITVSLLLTSAQIFYLFRFNQKSRGGAGGSMCFLCIIYNKGHWSEFPHVLMVEFKGFHVAGSNVLHH